MYNVNPNMNNTAKKAACVCEGCFCGCPKDACTCAPTNGQSSCQAPAGK